MILIATLNMHRMVFRTRLTKASTQYHEDRCFNVGRCVTVLIQTDQKLELVARLLKSVISIYPQIRFLVLDTARTDESKSPEWKRIKSEIGRNITYFQLNTGTTLGSNGALMYINTKYVLYVDKAMQFSKDTKLEKMMSVLDFSHYSIVGGKVNNSKQQLVGAIKMTTGGLRKKPILSIYKGVFPHAMNGHKGCFSTGIVTLFFLAKTNDLTESGDFDNPIGLFTAHESFSNVWRAGLNVAYCETVQVSLQKMGKADELNMQSFTWHYVKRLNSSRLYEKVNICEDKSLYLKDKHCK